VPPLIIRVPKAYGPFALTVKSSLPLSRRMTDYPASIPVTIPPMVYVGGVLPPPPHATMKRAKPLMDPITRNMMIPLQLFTNGDPSLLLCLCIGRVSAPRHICVSAQRFELAALGVDIASHVGRDGLESCVAVER
jgi:hypothetical protein